MEFGLILAGALLLDMLFGDPLTPWHPVALIGRTALWLEPIFRRIIRWSFLAGAACSLTVYGLFAVLPGMLVLGAMLLNSWLALCMTAVIVYFSIAPRCLCEHAAVVSRNLKAGNLEGARASIAMIVSRDPNALDERGIIRSGVESLGENVADGVTAALFYAAIGWIFGGVIGCAVTVWLYRTVNTLDATFGYKNERYRHFGTFPARTDDLLNFIPARLTPIALALAAGLLGLRPLNALRCAWRDHGKHPSPNSAWGMASFAGALGVQLGGKTKYATGWDEYPFWGNNLEPLTVKHLDKACRLVWGTTVIFAIMMILLSLAIVRLKGML